MNAIISLISQRRSIIVLSLVLILSVLMASPGEATTLTPGTPVGAIHQVITLADDSLLAVYQTGPRLEIRQRNLSGDWQNPAIIFFAPDEDEYPYNTIFSIQTLAETTAIIFFDGGTHYRLTTFTNKHGLETVDIPVDDIKFVTSSDDTLVLANTTTFLTWTDGAGFSDSIVLPSYQDEEDDPELLITNEGVVAYIYFDPNYDDYPYGNLFIQMWDSQADFFTSGPTQLEPGTYFYEISATRTTSRGDIIFTTSTGYTDNESGFHHGGDSYLFGWSSDSGWSEVVVADERIFSQALSSENKKIQFVFDTSLNFDSIEGEPRPDHTDKTIYRWVHTTGWREELVIDVDIATTLVTVNGQSNRAYDIVTWTEDTQRLQIYRWKKRSGWKTLSPLTLQCDNQCSTHRVTISSAGKVLVTWQDDKNNYFGQVYHPTKQQWLKPKQFNTVTLPETYSYVPLTVTTTRGHFLTLWQEANDALYWRRWIPGQGWQHTKTLVGSGADNISVYDATVVNNSLVVPSLVEATVMLYTINLHTANSATIAHDIDTAEMFMVENELFFELINLDKEFLVQKAISE